MAASSSPPATRPSAAASSSSPTSAVPQTALGSLEAAPNIGQILWCVDKELEKTKAFFKARVVEMQSNASVVVHREGANYVQTVPLRCCWPVNEFSTSSEGDADDVSQLTHQHEAGLLDNLRCRFARGVMCAR